MKKTLSASLLLLALMISAISCQKKQSTPFTYSVSGLSDISVTVDDSITLPIQVTTLTGNAEDVTLAVTGLPANIKGIITPDIGKPPYTAQLKIAAADNATTGATVITVGATNASTGSKTYNVNLTVNAKPDCSSDVEGVYSAADVCSSGNDAYTVVISATSQANQVKINNIYDEGFIVTATLDCSKHAITIPFQTMNNGVTFSGSGTYSGNTMTINYNVVGAVVSNSCTLNLTK